MSVSVGCSGWSFDDWVGKFYPMDLAKKKGEWFSFYAGYFNSVEINSTFYRPPNDFMVNSWIIKAKAFPGFEYSVKMPQLVTHESMVKGEALTAREQAASFERICVKPLAREGMMGSVLLQLSPYFKNEGNAQKSLATVLDAVDYGNIDYSVEFRHRSWLDESKREIVSDAAELLTERNVAIVLVDGPGFPITHRETADHGYVRFHGRNYDIWYTDEKEGDQRLNRYDYLYTKEQLQAWVPRIREAEKDKTRVRLFFNNHGRSKAVRNAFDMMDLLQMEHKSKEIKLQDQRTLPQS
ncbi:MAG: DUF72 domain-containing protein [Methanomassiliicoccales archaeon]|nr:DUF72 domain-containing protein [Methanomassiliicoccales archaeon]